MKSLTLICALLFAGVAQAQSVNVKDIDAEKESTTTIEITKGKKGEETKSKWEIQEGNADVEGESAATNKEAKATWKKACEDWKKEFRADNKDNKIMSISCGTVACSGDAGSKVCNSKATYKIKTKME